MDSTGYYLLNPFNPWLIFGVSFATIGLIMPPGGLWMLLRLMSFASITVLLFSLSVLGVEKEEAKDTSADGTTPLHWAVRADDSQTADRLLRNGADAKAADRYGVTPLYLACVNGNAAMIRRLLDAGADPNSKDPAGETALMTAARTGTPEALKVLIDHGAVVNAVDPEFEQTALMLAVRENHPSAVKLLINGGAELDMHTKVGATPAFRPPCKGTGCGSEGVGINRGGLPDRGIRAATPGGLTALLYAARDGRPQEARSLVAAGADVNLADPNGISPLLMAIVNNHLDVAKFLLDNNANVNADDFWGRTPL